MTPADPRCSPPPAPGGPSPSPPDLPPDHLLPALRRHLGFPSFRPGQERLISAVLRGRDAVGVLPTGGGKSACFQLPAFLLRGTVMVVSPLISLMEDQVGRARAAGLVAEALNASRPASERLRVLEAAAKGEVGLLFVSPERLQLPSFLQVLPKIPVSLLAVDEAHCISLWGHEFRPAYGRIGELRPRIRAPVLALTATATPRVRQEIREGLGLRSPVQVTGTFDRPNLIWEVRGARTHGEKMEEIRNALRAREGATIVYAATRKAVEAIRRNLASLGLPALAYHAGLPPRTRSGVQERFLRDPAPLVVATNAFGMGIDRADVRRVLHYQLPGSLEAYYQEAGRAGRDGSEARCTALFGPRDRHVHDAFLAAAYPRERRLRRLHRHLLRRTALHREARIPSAELKGLLGRRAGDEEVLAALRALARCGALVFEDPRDPGDAGGRPPAAPAGRHGGSHSLVLRSPVLCLDTLARRREVEESHLDAVLRYARSRLCRRRLILGYFGETPREPSCGRCDRCRGGPVGGGSGRTPGPAGLFTRGGRE